MSADARSDDLASMFFARTQHPKQKQIAFLLEKGVPAAALGNDADGDGFAIGVARVEKVGRRFDFREDGTNAVVTVARDEDGEPADLVAWLPSTGWFGPWFDALPLLGMHDLLAPRLGEPLAVTLDPLNWFRAGRTGVVILDRKRAWLPLERITIAAASLEEGIELRRILDRPKPKIVIPNTVERLAA